MEHEVEVEAFILEVVGPATEPCRQGVAGTYLGNVSLEFRSVFQEPAASQIVKAGPLSIGAIENTATSFRVNTTGRVGIELTYGIAGKRNVGLAVTINLFDTFCQLQNFVVGGCDVEIGAPGEVLILDYIGIQSDFNTLVLHGAGIGDKGTDTG